MRKSEATHKSMVQTVYDHLKAHGYSNILADHIGGAQPGVITWKGQSSGHIPDVTAKLSGTIYVFEVETADSIEDSHTLSQWELFSAYAKQNNGRFIPVVPASSQELAKRVLVSNGIHYDDLWTIG
jgi:hypothetical protein